MSEGLNKVLLLGNLGADPELRVASENGADLGNAYDLLDREFKRPLERIPGVARVDLTGVGRPEVQIELSSDRLSAHNINLNDLYQRLRMPIGPTAGAHCRFCPVREACPENFFRTMKESES